MADAIINRKGGSSGYSTVNFNNYSLSNSNLLLTKGSKYKFNGMSNEVEISNNVETIQFPSPVTGYIKFKNITLS